MADSVDDVSAGDEVSPGKRMQMRNAQPVQGLFSSKKKTDGIVIQVVQGFYGGWAKKKAGKGSVLIIQKKKAQGKYIVLISEDLNLRSCRKVFHSILGVFFPIFVRRPQHARHPAS